MASERVHLPVCDDTAAMLPVMHARWVSELLAGDAVPPGLGSLARGPNQGQQMGTPPRMALPPPQTVRGEQNSPGPGLAAPGGVGVQVATWAA